jgi:hypothetical protein
MLLAEGYQFKPALLFLLTNGENAEKVDRVNLLAKKCNCSRSFIYQVISGKKKSVAVRGAVLCALGFDPWETNKNSRNVF